jgi:hypothetical protein
MWRAIVLLVLAGSPVQAEIVPDIRAEVVICAGFHSSMALQIDDLIRAQKLVGSGKADPADAAAFDFHSSRENAFSSILHYQLNSPRQISVAESGVHVSRASRSISEAMQSHPTEGRKYREKLETKCNGLAREFKLP